MKIEWNLGRGYAMLDNQIQTLGKLWKDPETRNLLHDGAFSLMKLVLFKDLGSGADALRSILKFHTLTLVYWDKMWRYMNGVFRDPIDQIKMSEKFCDDNPRYEEFVRRQMNLINEINDDQKIDYFAALTRSFLYTGMDEVLYLKLAKFLTLCTPGELNFLRDVCYKQKVANSMMASSVYQYGLLMIEYQDDGLPVFALSDFGKALKQNSLNFDDGICGLERIVSYDSMTPAELKGIATDEDIDKIFQNQEILFDSVPTQRSYWE